MGELDGHVGLVTGGGRGIGKVVALRLAEAGAAVAVSARSEDEIEAVAEEIRGAGGTALAVACDVSDSEQVNSMVAHIAQDLGPVSILVNNAGIAASHKFDGHDDALWHKIIAVNLTGTYYTSKAVVPGMRERGGGRIINVASLAATTGAPYVAAYTASKHGVLGLTRSNATELVRYGITVNAVCPGYVDTPMTDQSIATIANTTRLNEAEALATLERNSPQRRLFDSEEVAAAVMMLVGEGGRGITGQAINIDGGVAIMH